MDARLPLSAIEVRGFLDQEEGTALYVCALETSGAAPCLEIGSYCGKSTLWIGTACKERGSLLFAVDHHRGSEEHQPGQLYHEPDLYDARDGLMDTFRTFRQTLRGAQLEEWVVPIVAASSVAARHWTTPLGLVFIDGGHSEDAALTDYRSWAPHVRPGGILAIHDVFFDPSEGGQAPRRIYELALASGLYEALPMVKTLGLLRRIRD